MRQGKQIVAGTVLSVVLFGAGFLIGRQFPEHHYERFGKGPFLYDSSSGRICSIIPNEPVPSGSTSDNPWGLYAVNPHTYPVCGK